MTKTTPATATEAVKETKAEKFIRLANQRAVKVLDALDSLSGLSNRNQYEFTDEQIAKLFGVIDAKIDEIAAPFKSKEAVKKSTASIL